MNYPEHKCSRSEDGRPALVTCGTCFASWCEQCDPAPSALCHTCHGRGYSTAPVPPRQRQAARIYYPRFRRPAWQASR